MCVVLTAQVGVLFIQYPVSSLESGRYALYGLSNIHFYLRSTDYFGEDARHNLFTHTWSLGVEEQFYLILPMVFLVAHSTVIHRKLGGNSAMLGVLVFLGGGSLAIWITMSAAMPAFSYFMLPARFWELALGCIAFFALNRRRVSPAILKVVSIVSTIVFFSVPFFPKAHLDFSTVAICLATAGLIATIGNNGILHRCFSMRPVVVIGLISYSLYLWHWPVIVLSRYTVGLGAFILPFQLMAVLALATLSYLLVERPFRHGGRFLRKGIVIAVGLVGLGIASVYLAVLGIAPNRYFSANLPRFDITRPVFTQATSFHECTETEDFKDTAFPPKCSHVQSATAKTLWFAGDSTTWALKGLASKASEATGTNLVMFAKDSAFPSAVLRPHDPVLGARREKSRLFFEEVFAYVQQHAKVGDILVIGGDISNVFCVAPELFCRNGDGSQISWRTEDGSTVQGEKALQAFLDEINLLAKNLSQKGAAVVLHAPLPRWTRDHRIFCEAQWYRPQWENARCDEPAYAAQTASRERLMTLLKRAHIPGGYFLYDPFLHMCTATLCRFSDPQTNTNWWIDETHLSTAGGIRLADHFVDFLRIKGLSE